MVTLRYSVVGYPHWYSEKFSQSDHNEALHRLSGKVKIAGLTALPLGLR